MKAQLLKESNIENIVAPITLNLKLRLKTKAITATKKRNNPKIPKILGVFSNSSKKDI